MIIPGLSDHIDSSPFTCAQLIACSMVHGIVSTGPTCCDCIFKIDKQAVIHVMCEFRTSVDYVEIDPKCCFILVFLCVANCRYTEVISYYTLPPHNEVVGGYIGFTPSVRPSIRPSRILCLLCSAYSFGWIWLWIWCESLVWVIMGWRGISQNVGVLVVLVWCSLT